MGKPDQESAAAEEARRATTRDPPHLPPLLQDRWSTKVPHVFRALAQAADTGKRMYGLVQRGFPFSWPSRQRIAATWRWGRTLATGIRRRRREDGLTVAVDISPFFDALTGVGWYLHELLHQLADRPGLRLRLYGPSMCRHPHSPQLATALVHNSRSRSIIALHPEIRGPA